MNKTQAAELDTTLKKLDGNGDGRAHGLRMNPNSIRDQTPTLRSPPGNVDRTTGGLTSWGQTALVTGMNSVKALQASGTPVQLAIGLPFGFTKPSP
ncbi:MAG: hypothetical protein H7338_21735 [Candidatus Sericytochromatia bacterium]|nr:hypothetical protein [Candidatus Sericytochromatia bacterium]